MDLVALILAFCTAGLVAGVLTPLAGKMATLLDVVDRPSERKVSDREGIPLLGGIAVVSGCGMGLVAYYFAADRSQFMSIQDQLASFIAGGTLLVLVGAWDDRFDLGAWQKIPFQLLASLIAINSGFVIDYFTNPLTLETHLLPTWFSWLITLGWIVVVTNAMNLIDGLDGLTAGIGVIIAATLGIICFQASQPAGLLISLVMLGALLGFLPFNFRLRRSSWAMREPSSLDSRLPSSRFRAIERRRFLPSSSLSLRSPSRFWTPDFQFLDASELEEIFFQRTNCICTIFFLRGKVRIDVRFYGSISRPSVSA